MQACAEIKSCNLRADWVLVSADKAFYLRGTGSEFEQGPEKIGQLGQWAIGEETMRSPIKAASHFKGNDPEGKYPHTNLVAETAGAAITTGGPWKQQLLSDTVILPCRVSP
ncbi:hypothetical protein SKAU_G00335640 [Synaphobranchus kaupii]|uniref:Uncharacterized protein n=1 Tax=Synaphobranchus kaupii TaxID=118154 RepID=A0A9Q1EM12_SYNKA|nr:hypothetical protein SKAU_G00335640 [Synaphobranchus kaupii]